MNEGCREKVRGRYIWKNQTRCDLQVIACGGKLKKPILLKTKPKTFGNTFKSETKNSISSNLKYMTLSLTFKVFGMDL